MDFLVSLPRRGLGNQVPASEPLAIPSSTDRCETRRRTLACCVAASIVTSLGSAIESITRNRGLEQAIRSKQIDPLGDDLSNTSLRSR